MAPRTCSYHVNSSLVMSDTPCPSMAFLLQFRDISIAPRQWKPMAYNLKVCRRFYAVHSDVLRSFWEWRILRQLPHESSQNCLELLSKASPSTCLITISLWGLQSWLHRRGPACEGRPTKKWQPAIKPNRHMLPRMPNYTFDSEMFR